MEKAVQKEKTRFKKVEKKSGGQKGKKKIEQDIGKDLGKSIGKFFKGWGKILGGIITIIVNIIMLVIINKYHSKIPFLTDEIVVLLPYINISTCIAIVGQMIFLVITSKVVRDILQSIMDIFALIVCIQTYLIFPFDFTEISGFAWLKVVVRIGLILAITAVPIGIIVRIVKLTLSIFKVEKS